MFWERLNQTLLPKTEPIGLLLFDGRHKCRMSAYEKQWALLLKKSDIFLWYLINMRPVRRKRFDAALLE